MIRIVVCSLLGSAFLFAAAPTPARSTTLDATAVLKTFYTWYFRVPNHNWSGRFAEVKALFDPGLYTMLQTVVHKEARAREPIMDFDPFVNAQYDVTAYALGTPVVKNSNVNVPVALTLYHGPNNKARLTAVLRKNAVGRYVIYNLVYDPKNNLRDLLGIWVKE